MHEKEITYCNLNLKRICSVDDESNEFILIDFSKAKHST